jgi:hypothetical protein
MPILDAVSEFDDVVRPLIVYEAVLLGRSKDRNVTSDLFLMKSEAERAVLTYYTFAQLGSPDFWADFADEDSYA